MKYAVRAGGVEILDSSHGAARRAYVQTVRAVCANGSVGEALGVAVEIAETSTRLADRPTLLALPVAGTFASLLWIAGFDHLASVEADNAKLLASDEWLKLIDRAGYAFAPGATASVLRRLN